MLHLSLPTLNYPPYFSFDRLWSTGNWISAWRCDECLSKETETETERQREMSVNRSHWFENNQCLIIRSKATSNELVLIKGWTVPYSLFFPFWLEIESHPPFPLLWESFLKVDVVWISAKELMGQCKMTRNTNFNGSIKYANLIGWDLKKEKKEKTGKKKNKKRNKGRKIKGKR